MNDTAADAGELGGVVWSTSKALLFVFQLLVMLETIFGNLLVVLSVKMEKKLQTPFNYYIVNLAITDMNVGISVMSLFAIYNLYGYFPFSTFVCGYWVWSDYTMTFESVFTLMTISIDRFWSVTWSTHYRNTYSVKKCLILLGLTWCVVNTIWLPAFIYDRVANAYAVGECYWDPLRNRYLGPAC
ncbi:muscarinic acetylcholine receptor M1-like [Pollicipes pollicipes]|uniref:muscarinic acetylcholine receptor M1-like n=1 Tax=Pollicipes pollicipes TaxID=41117 RepID=UPI001884A5C5|nr:muscarinic acetylcholine receptor M1-like [Pollicipes pollicipes]